MLTAPIPSTAATLRVLVVEDSVTIRKYLAKVLQTHGIEVVGEAEDGLRAVALCQQLKPDVITMDMILPGLNGLAATEQIMAYSPTPILIVSASVNRGELFQTYEALGAGAVDVLDKIKPGETAGEWDRRFVAAVRMAARIKVITHPRARLLKMARDRSEAAGSAAEPVAVTVEPARSGAARIPARALGTQDSRRVPGAESAGAVSLIAIGASTGGPAAIAEILGSLPADFAIPILIVLHISEMFSFAFADWLSTVSPFPARYAQDGEAIPQPGKPQIILAPAGRHLTVAGGVLHLTEAPERNSCRPSIDVLFESLAAEASTRTVFCLLTGMGKDGAAGMLAANRTGMITVAQDESSSVIFGMPAEAIRLGAATHVLPLPEIAPFFTSLSDRVNGLVARTEADRTRYAQRLRVTPWS